MSKESLAPQKDRLVQIIQYVKSKLETYQQIDAWWSSYFDNPEANLPLIFSAFQKLKKRTDLPEPVFLDYGSGDGTILHVAVLAGFVRACGIEINRSLFQLSIQALKTLQDQGVTPKEKVQIAHGSYYLSSLRPELVPRCLIYLQNRHADEEIIETNDFEFYLKTLLNLPEEIEIPAEELIAISLSPISQSDPHRALGIMSHQRIEADVIFISPSDVFFEAALSYQLAQTMNAGSLLAVLNPIDDLFVVPKDLRVWLQEEQPIFIPFASELKLQLQVFKKTKN